MSVIGTCGHEYDSLDDFETLQIKDSDRTGKRIVEVGIYCKECCEELRENGLVLDNDNEAWDWIMSYYETK